jgi:hypothetical protein
MRQINSFQLRRRFTGAVQPESIRDYRRVGARAFPNGMFGLVGYQQPTKRAPSKLGTSLCSKSLGISEHIND